MNNNNANGKPIVSQRKCIHEFTCLCGSVINFQGELKDHYFKCDRMKKHYSELFTTMISYNNKQLDLSQRKSLNAVIDMFNSEMFNTINNDLKK